MKMKKMRRTTKGVDDVREPLLTRLMYLLWWCAGADVETLKECPSDHAKFTAVGMFMLVVPCVATVSFNFLLQQSFGAQGLILALVSVGWGALIFILDRLILTFHRKGRREILRAVPRLVLSVSLALVVSEPLLLHFFRSEIGLEMRRGGQAVVTEARAKAEARVQPEKEALLNANAELQKRLDELKRVRDEKETAVIGEIEGQSGSGVKGDGIAARRKQEALEEAKAEFEKARGELSPQMAANKLRLEQLRAETEAEVKLIAEAQASSTGALARQQALFSIMRREPSAALTYVPLFLILLMIEIAPLTMKLTAPAGEYDKRLRLRGANGIARAYRDVAFERAEHRRETQVENEMKNRISEAVAEDKAETLSAPEREVASLWRGTLLESFRQEVLSRHAPQSWREKFDGEVRVEIVDAPELSVSWELPVEGRERVTLAGLGGDLEKIAKAVEANERPETGAIAMEAKGVCLVKATNSRGREVVLELPLLPQLEADRHLRLEFAPLDMDAREHPIA